MTKSLERDLQSVYTLPDNQPISGISFGFWPSLSGAANGASKGSGPRRAWVVITTKERMYEVQGEVSNAVAGGKAGGWAEELFKPVREGAPSE